MSDDRLHAWDGLRGLAVAAVLVYHVEGHPLPGGFLGVSLFFTLSGYLITGIIVDASRRSSGFDLASFWSRRFRRLLPAMALALVLVLAFSWFAATADQQATLPWDMTSAALDWSNWRFLLTGETYGGAVSNPSPLLHTWSLSVEVQVYVVLSLVLATVMSRRGPRTVLVVLAGLLAASVLTGVLVATHGQQWYLGTHVRAQEVLVGAVAAVAIRSRHRGRIQAVAHRVTPLALVGIGVAWWTATESSLWLPRGGLLLHAVATTCVVIAVTEQNIVSRVLSARPLAGLGRISYGVYLYHWPLYLWLTPRRLDLGVWPTTAVRVALTLVLAGVSYRLVEQPIIARRTTSRRTVSVSLAGVLAASALAFVVTPTADTGQQIDLTGGLIAPPSTVTGAPPPSALPPTTSPVVSDTAPVDTSPEATTTSTLPPPTPSDHVVPALRTSPDLDHTPRVLIIGDSAVVSFGPGVQSWASYLGVADVYAYGWVGCPITLGGETRWNDNVIDEIEDKCDMPEERQRYLDEIDPDLVVIYSSLWEVVDRRLPGRDDWVHIGQPVMDAEITRQMSDLTDMLVEQDRRVLWILPPPLKNSIYAQLPGPLPEEDPARMARLHEIISGIAATRRNVWTLDMPAVLDDIYGDPYALENRADGFHWTAAGAERDGSWMAPLFAEVAQQPLTADEHG